MFTSSRNAGLMVPLLIPLLIGVSLLGMPGVHGGPTGAPQQTTAGVSLNNTVALSSTAYLPFIQSPSTDRALRTVNAPYYGANGISYLQSAIFWFGAVTSQTNYADVRVGYNNNEIQVNVAVFDRLLWYDTNPSPDRLTAWDAVSLYLDSAGPTSSQPMTTSYRFDAQLSFWEPRARYQQAYLGNGAAWATGSTPFTTEIGWKGNAPNDTTEDRGWWVTYHIPFASLGLSGPPAQGTAWAMGLTLHDRDDAAGTPIADQVWPETLDPNRPAEWGRLVFGLPSYIPPAVTATQTSIIRNRLDGSLVTDAAVGGTIGNLCPGDSAYIWNEWGSANFIGAQDFNIQNQGDVSDWPCFAKAYVTFPLTAVPPDKAIVSATLTLYEWGGSDPTQALRSLIQVSTVADDWDPARLTWDNAPYALENVSQAWVDPVPNGFVGWPGVPYTWDVSRAVAQAYTSGQPLRLVLYEADWNYHSGKYFTGSEQADWDAQGRPTLRITWGDASPVRGPTAP